MHTLKASTAKQAANTVLALYDIIVESPSTDDAALKKMGSLLLH